jgi:hypothetical protein
VIGARLSENPSKQNAGERVPACQRFLNTALSLCACNIATQQYGESANMKPNPAQISPAASTAIRIIHAIRKNPSSQSPHAEKKILAQLSVPDYISVVLNLEDYPVDTEVPRG